MSGTIVPVRLLLIISTTLHESMRRYELLDCDEMGEGAILGFVDRKRANWHAFDVFNRRCCGDLTMRSGFDDLLPGYDLLVGGETGCLQCICFGILIYRRKMSAYPVGNFLFQGFGYDF